MSKWDCRNPDCYRLEYQLTDQMIIGVVLTVLNAAIANPNLIENNGEISTYSPTADVIRGQNEINQMIDSDTVGFRQNQVRTLQAYRDEIRLLYLQ